LAAVASLPGRPLAAMLRSLRPQVDELAVYLNGHKEVPQIVKDLDCRYVLDEGHSGAEQKFHWTGQWDGVYLSVDDDFTYPPNYVEQMGAELARWDGAAIVGLLGRRYEGKVAHWREFTARYPHQQPYEWGAWVNLIGTGTAAFDTRVVRPPSTWEFRNALDAQLAVWCQQWGIPMRIVPRPRAWITIARRSGPDSVFKQDEANGFELRNGLMQSGGDWKVYRATPVGWNA
jgi:hypothetical protein